MAGRDIGVPLIAGTVSVALMAAALYSATAGLALAGLMPVAIATGWCLSWLTCGGLRQHFFVAVAAVAVTATMSVEGAFCVLVYIAVGVSAGWVLCGNLSWDRRLALVVWPLIALTIYETTTMDIVASFDQLTGYSIAEMQRNPPVGTDEIALQNLLNEAERGRQAMLDFVGRFWPGMLFLGQLGVAGLVLILASAVGRRWTGRAGVARVPAFNRWRVPWFLVWVLAVGVLLVLLRVESVSAIGENLVLVACCLFGLQGLAIQVFVIGRFLRGWQQTIFWLVVGLFLGPVAAIGGVVLGLLDQWLDLRRMVEAAEVQKR